MKQRANIFYCKLLFDVDAIKQLFHLPQFSLKYFQIIQLSTSHNASSNWLSRFLCDKISCLCLPFPTFLRETKSSRLLTQLLLSQGSTSLQSFFDIFCHMFYILKDRTYFHNFFWIYPLLIIFSICAYISISTVRSQYPMKIY